MCASVVGEAAEGVQTEDATVTGKDEATLRTPTERTVAAVWARVLELKAGSLGPYAHFFELGGNSLTSTRMYCGVSIMPRGPCQYG